MNSKLTIILYLISIILKTVITHKINDYAENTINTYDNFDRISSLKVDSVGTNVEVNLYLISDPDFPYQLNFDTIPNAPINKNLSTNIIIHGWLDDSDDLWVLRMKDKYFLNGAANVIVVNWGEYANNGYVYASLKIEEVAEYVSNLLASLSRSGKLNIQDIHIIGFDLGAHLAGFIGKNLQNDLNEVLGHITGLDPSKTFYEYFIPISSKKRLAKTDAEFVDVIHTCAGNLGMTSAIGHADFFPNGGKYSQPGCGTILQITCSHHRAYEFYMESITTKMFIATKCNSWTSFKNNECVNGDKVVMGLHLNSTASGRYFLRTNSKAPFSQG